MSVLSQLTLPVLNESTQEVEDRQFDLPSGGVSSNTYTVLDTESSTINNSDFVPMSEYDSDDDVYTKKKVTWSNIIAKIKNALPTTVPSHVGQVIESTTLSTLAQVQAVYGTNTTWIQLSGYVLRGATSSVTANNNQNDGGADSVTVSSVASHNHTQNAHTHTQNSHNHTQNAHTHTQNAHTHGASSNTTGSHTHKFNAWRYVDTGKVTLNGTILGWPKDGVETTSAGDHSHTITVNNATATNQNTTATNNAQTATNQNTTATNNANGANYTVNTLPKYKNVYIWERTA